MAYGLPAHGEANWDAKISASLTALQDGTVVNDTASGMRAALDETMRERDTAAAYVDFTTKPDGAAPLTMDTGQTVVTAFPANGNHPTIASGRLVPGGTLDAGSYGDYYQASIGSDVQRVGCEWTQPSGADDGHGSVALVLWGSIYDGLGNIPSARCHLTIRPGTGTSGFWEYAVFRGDGSAYCAVKNGSFVNPPADGATRWSSDVTFDLNQGIAFVSLPDGQIVTVTNAEISSAMTGAGQTPMTLAQLGGTVAVAEHYASTGANVAKFPGFTALWAEPVLPDRFRRAVSPQTLARAIKGLKDNIAPATTYLRYMPTTLGSHTATTSVTSADGSNLYVTGTFGPTGKILIDVDTYYEFTGTETVFGYLAEITTGTPTSALETMVNGVSGDKKNVHHLFEITGGTPGVTKAWTYQHSGLTGGLATAKWGGSGAGLVPPFTMRTTGL